jgi:hypothetical protein
VRIGWIKIAIGMLGVNWGVQGCVVPEMWRTKEGSGGSLSWSGPTTAGRVFYGGKAKGWLVESDTGYGSRGKVGEEMRTFGCVGLV